MPFESFKNNFISSQQEVEEVVKNAVDQLLQKSVGLEKQMTQVDNLQTAVAEIVFPCAYFSFSSAAAVNQLIVMEPDFVKQFYAWMIADEPAEELGEEQLEGLKEAFDQVFGQIKIAIADDQATFTVDDFKLEMASDGGAFSEIATAQPAMFLDYKFSVEDQSFNIKYFAWPVPGAESKASMDMNDGQTTGDVGTQEVERVTVQPAEFGDLSGAGTEYGQSRNVDMLLDVNLEVTVELDRKTMMVADLLKLGKGSIIEMEKSAGEPLDIFINGRKFAEGEVVVIDDKFGIRLTQLLSPRDRIKSLGV